MGFLSKLFKRSKKSEVIDCTNDKAIHADSQSNSMKITGDNPITLPEEDTIGRNSLAKSFAKQILSLDTSKGSVIGVLGAWGSGKTSFINLAKNELNQKNITVLDFNPWMFSGTEQLMQSFFSELSAQLKLRPDLSRIGETIGTYGDILAGVSWIPLVGSWFESGHKAAEAISKVLEGRKEGVGAHRKKIEDALIKYGKRIIVVIDDIDRLSTAEIRDIFKLVRLTANFPNIIYVLAFDRFRVENALNEEGINGRDYLEKILQVVIDIPPIPYQILTTQVLTAIDNAIKNIEKVGPFDTQIWPDIFMEIIRPLIRTMRDVRRYAANIHGTVASLDGKVALTDVLALEAVRIFLPDVFKLLHLSIDALTTTDNHLFGNSRNTDSLLKAKIEKIIEVAGDNSNIIRNMICRLFPAARRHIENYHYGAEWKKEWLRERRVAHEDILNFYLERIAGDHFKAFMHAEKAQLFMDNRELFDDYLHSLDASEITDVITALEIYEDQYNDKHVEPASIVLLNIMYELPNNRSSMFDYDVRLKVMRVVYRLIRSLKVPDIIESAVKSILPEVKTLSAKYELISIVGHKKGKGQELISEEAAKQIELEWAHEVKAATVEDLLKEPELLRILLCAKKSLLASGELIEISDTSELTLAVLKSSQREVMSQSIDSRAVRKETYLAWDALIELYGDEDILKNRINQAKDISTVDDKEIIELADKYKNGWRPERF
ncbi:MAG: P-loop NTPase fold protein [Caulobacteraceae bacterium]